MATIKINKRDVELFADIVSHFALRGIAYTCEIRDGYFVFNVTGA
jgi:hypothetical protein